MSDPLKDQILVQEMPSSLSDNVNGVRRPVSGNCEPTSHLLNFKPSGSAAAHVLVCESGMFVGLWHVASSGGRQHECDPRRP